MIKQLYKKHKSKIPKIIYHYKNFVDQRGNLARKISLINPSLISGGLARENKLLAKFQKKKKGKMYSKQLAMDQRANIPHKTNLCLVRDFSLANSSLKFKRRVVRDTFLTNPLQKFKRFVARDKSVTNPSLSFTYFFTPF